MTAGFIRGSSGCILASSHHKTGGHRPPLQGNSYNGGMTESDYIRCATKIADALKLNRGEQVLIKLDPRVFARIVEPLQGEIRKAGAVICAVILAEETTESSAAELNLLRRQFADADVFIWLPELHQGNRPALEKSLVEWLDSKRGRAIHFHWHSGSY